MQVVPGYRKEEFRQAERIDTKPLQPSVTTPKLPYKRQFRRSVQPPYNNLPNTMNPNIRGSAVL